MVVNQEINYIAEEIKKEVNTEIDLSIGSIENPSEATPVLIERMDKVCALMDYQSTLISYAETALEEAKFQYKRKSLNSKKRYNESLCRFKQEDRQKPRDQRRTDVEYEAMAELESDILVNEELSAERVYLASQHKLDDEKHRYEILQNHFLSYRKAADLLIKEMNKLGGIRERMGGP
jgi:hypothetical protein